MAHALTLRVGVGAVTVTSAATSTAGGSLSCRGLSAVAMFVAVPTTPAAATGALLRGFHRNGSFSSGRSVRRLRTVSAAAASTAAVLHSGSFLRLSFRRSGGSSSTVPVSMSPTATGATALCCGRCIHQLEHLIESLGSGFRQSLTHCFVLTRSRSHVPHAGMHITSQCRGHLPFRARPAASRSPTAHNNPVHPSIVHLPNTRRSTRIHPFAPFTFTPLPHLPHTRRGGAPTGTPPRLAKRTFRTPAQRPHPDVPQSRSANSASTSTDAFRGSTATPTAERACDEPKISARSSEAPFATAACP